MSFVLQKLVDGSWVDVKAIVNFSVKNSTAFIQKEKITIDPLDNLRIVERVKGKDTAQVMQVNNSLKEVK